MSIRAIIANALAPQPDEAERLRAEVVSLKREVAIRDERIAEQVVELARRAQDLEAQGRRIDELGAFMLAVKELARRV